MTVYKWYWWMKPNQDNLSLLVPSSTTVRLQAGDMMCGERGLVSFAVSPVQSAKLCHTHILKGELQNSLINSN